MYAIGGELKKFEYLEPVDALNALYEGNRRVIPASHLPGDARLWDLPGKGLLYEPSNQVLMLTRHNIAIHVFHGLERRGVRPEHNGIFIARNVFAGVHEDLVSEELSKLPKNTTFSGPVFPYYPNTEGGYHAEEREFPVEVAGRNLYGTRNAAGQMEWILMARLVPLYH